MAAQESAGKAVMVQGRIVWTAGDLFKGRVKTIFGTNKPQLDDKGQTIQEYGFGLAVPKSALVQGQPGFDLWVAIHEEAASIYPSRQYPRDFAWKYDDGDGPDSKGAPFSQREGYAGCLVFKMTTRIQPKFYKWENGANILVPEGIKCGDYVNVQVQVKAQGSSTNPGMYLNPQAAQFLGYGKEIINAPSGDQIFGTQAPPMPAGASAMPVAPQGSTPLMPSAPPMPGAAAPQYAPPQAAPPPMAAQPAQPHYGVLPPAHQPPPQAASPMQQAPQGYAPPPAYPPQQAAPMVPQAQAYGAPPMPQQQYQQPMPPPGYPAQR